MEILNNFIDFSGMTLVLIGLTEVLKVAFFKYVIKMSCFLLSIEWFYCIFH